MPRSVVVLIMVGLYRQLHLQIYIWQGLINGQYYQVSQAILGGCHLKRRSSDLDLTQSPLAGQEAFWRIVMEYISAGVSGEEFTAH